MIDYIVIILIVIKIIMIKIYRKFNQYSDICY